MAKSSSSNTCIGSLHEGEGKIVKTAQVGDLNGSVRADEIHSRVSNLWRKWQ